MARLSKWVAIVFACVLWSALSHAQQRPRVTSVKGFVFDNDKGEFSKENVFAEGFLGLWNQVQVDAVLVVVEVTGEPNGLYWRKQDKKYKLRLSTRGGKTWTQTRPILTLGEHGTRYLSFLVYHDTCAALTLGASVVGPGTGPTVEVSLSFQCGE